DRAGRGPAPILSPRPEAPRPRQPAQADPRLNVGDRLPRRPPDPPAGVGGRRRRPGRAPRRDRGRAAPGGRHGASTNHPGGDMSERTIEKARQVVHRLSEWYFAGGGDNDPDSPIDREDLDALHDLVRTAEATAEMERRQAGAYADVAAVVRRELEAPGAGEDVRERVAREVFAL